RFPPPRHRTRSPVRYSRSPPSSLNRFGTNRSPVIPAWFRYPRATPAPPIYSSPPTPTGTVSISPFSTYTCVFPIGFPIGTQPSHSLSASYTQHPTVASVGPYSLNIRVFSASFLHPRTAAPLNDSPPTT